MRETAARAVQFFQQNFGQVSRPVAIDVEYTEFALRPGFRAQDDVVNFPANAQGFRPELGSRDIITHEVFHALMHQAYPQYSEPDKIRGSDFVRLHEGLADYFTHLLYPDDSFGEDRTGNSNPLRYYRNDRRVSLSPGGHAQGNAITSYLIKNQVSPAQIRGFLEGGQFTLEALAAVDEGLSADLKLDQTFELQDQIFNYQSSVLHRYWLEQGRPLGVSFQSNEALSAAHPELRVRWVNPSGFPVSKFEIRAQQDGSFQITPLAESGTEKVIALFEEGDRLLGSRPFYFGVEAGRTPAAPE